MTQAITILVITVVILLYLLPLWIATAARLLFRKAGGSLITNLVALASSAYVSVKFITQHVVPSEYGQNTAIIFMCICVLLSYAFFHLLAGTGVMLGDYLLSRKKSQHESGEGTQQGCAPQIGVRQKGAMTKTPIVERLLIGRWVSCDVFGSMVEHRVSVVKGTYRVNCTDTDDGEKAETYDVVWDGQRLRYNLYWSSTGRFSKNAMFLQSKNQVELTFTYTEKDILCKKPVSGKRIKTKK